MTSKAKLLASHQLEDGKWLCLVERTARVGGEPRVHHQLTVSGIVLMEIPFGAVSVRQLAEIGLARVRLRPAPSVLIGGLGFGLTLGAALDLLPPDGSVVVSELYGAVLDWNREHLAMVEGHRLGDSRVRVEIEDVCERIRQSEGAFDAILLDTDNTTKGFHRRQNDWLYEAEGIAAMHRALRPGGNAAVWSTEPDALFHERLRQGGFEAVKHDVSTRHEQATVSVAHKK